MTQPTTSFGEFERAAWEDSALADKYHEHLSTLTKQSVAALLDAAKVSAGARVSEGTARAAATLTQTPAARWSIRSALREAVLQYKAGQGYEVPMPPVLTAAVKLSH